MSAILGETNFTEAICYLDDVLVRILGAAPETTALGVGEIRQPGHALSRNTNSESKPLSTWERSSVKAASV